MLPFRPWLRAKEQSSPRRGPAVHIASLAALAMASLFQPVCIPVAEAAASRAYCPGIHFDSRYYRKKARNLAWVKRHPLTRVMFIGNSITRHAPDANLGWNNHWGMAASAPDRDWVHRVQLYLSIDQAKPVDISVFSTDIPWVDRDFEALRTALEAFRPEVAIIQIGDNARSDAAAEFKGPFAKLLALTAGYTTRLYLLNTWKLSYELPATGIYMRQMAEAYRAKFIDIAWLYLNPYNRASAEPYCANAPGVDPNVCWHPGDTGMQAIAAEVCR